MALLPFLGAGQTHKEGKYQETVERGLAFLVRQMKLGNGMGDLSDAGGQHVLARAGDHHVVRSLCHDERSRAAPTSSAGPELHRVRPGSRRGWLAVRTASAGRHVGVWAGS